MTTRATTSTCTSPTRPSRRRRQPAWCRWAPAASTGIATPTTRTSSCSPTPRATGSASSTSATNTARPYRPARLTGRGRGIGHPLALAVHLRGLVPRGLPAVDRDDGPGDERGLVRAQPEHGLGHLGRGAHPPHRRRHRRRADRLLAGCLDVIGPDRARRHYVDPDALVGVVEGRH